MEWKVEFLDEKAESEFLALPDDVLASLLRIVALIEEYGLLNVGMPYVRHLQGKLWEMRGKGRDGIARSIYVAAAGQRVIVVRSFIKKTARTPLAEIKIALTRAKEIA